MRHGKINVSAFGPAAQAVEVLEVAGMDFGAGCLQLLRAFRAAGEGAWMPAP